MEGVQDIVGSGEGRHAWGLCVCTRKCVKRKGEKKPFQRWFERKNIYKGMSARYSIKKYLRVHCTKYIVL